MAHGGKGARTQVEAHEGASIAHPIGESPKMQRPWGPIVALLLLIAAVAAITWMHQRERPSIGGPFELIDASTGHQVTDRDFRGKWLLVFFGYTHCPDFCPTTLNDIADTMENLGALANQIQPLFITVDPKRDTPQALSEYTGAFDPRIHGLTGTPDQVAVAAKAYGVYYAKRDIGDDYSIDHSSATYVMRPDGGYQTSFLNTDGPEEMTKRLRQLLGEGR